MFKSKSFAFICALCGLALVNLATPATSAQPNRPAIKVYLRRATFDPLSAIPPTTSALPAGASSRLVLAQFTREPTADIRQALVAAGATPLLYIPDNTLVIRLGAAGMPALPDLRWSGPFAPAYKLAADLDSLISQQGSGLLNARLLIVAGANIDDLSRELARLGGVVLSRSAGLNGVNLEVRLPATGLADLVRRDDVLWVERFAAPQVQNDRARGILGVTAARRQLGWLTGAGQIVAVTDTGLDVENNLSADFAGRVLHAFTPWEVGAGGVNCVNTSAASTWSDRNGHGTHVAGTVLGSGANSPAGLSYAGVAPGASLVVQAVSTGGDTLDCLAENQSFLAQAYGTGARVQNASWSDPTTPGAYSQFSSYVDDFLWQHKDHLFVVAAGNNTNPDKNPRDGVIDAASIYQPATAKNVLSVGSTENDRPPTGSSCATLLYSLPQQDQCWGKSYGIDPIATDFISDNIDGMAAFSSRGPADDGRIKPEIVAPGTNVISAASHSSSASYPFGKVGADYAYDNGTSMSAPMISGMAALVRQWLAQSRQINAPSAALIKAMLLNGATNISPGQYGIGAQREIPADWPNNVEGWGRADLLSTIGISGTQEVWLADNTNGLPAAGTVASYTLVVGAGQPLRFTLAWADYPAAPNAGKALVNDLDLEVKTPNGDTVIGNATAALPIDCRDAQTQADRCDNVESVEIAAPMAGIYTVQVRAAKLPQPSQPFALVGRARSITDRPLDAPALQPATSAGSSSVKLSWNAVDGATFYVVEQSAANDFASITRTYMASEPGTAIVEDVGTYWFRVRACTLGGCSLPSNARSTTVATPPHKLFLTFISPN